MCVCVCVCGGGGGGRAVQSITFVNRLLCLAARAHPVRLRCLATLPVFQYTLACIETAARNLVRIFFSSVRQALPVLEKRIRNLGIGSWPYSLKSVIARTFSPCINSIEYSKCFQI